MTSKTAFNNSTEHNYHTILRTQLQKGRSKELEKKRIRRINESIIWKGGPSFKNPLKHIVARTPSNEEVYFLKPGKEVYENRKRPNPHDMTPVIGHDYKPYQFDDIWEKLSRISVRNFEIFRVVLVLIYRNAYMLDHIEEDKNHIRYKPSKSILDCINELNDGLSDIVELGLFGFLHFLDILGWNEDVKYHVENNKPRFESTGRFRWKIGRLNTLLTCINIPYKAHMTVSNIIKHSSKPQDINWKLFYEMMQTLSARGVSPPRQRDLLEWFSPYIVVDDV